PSAIMLGDVDGDGKNDVLVVNSASGRLSVFRNTSASGSISLAARVDFIFTNNGRSISLADINKDGRPEIIVGSDGYVYVYPNAAVAGTINSSSFGSPVAIRSSGGEFMIAARDI